MSGRATASPTFVLCGVGGENVHLAGGWHFPARGRLTLGERREEAAVRRGFRGLAWGVGDPAAAFLDAPRWAVVCVDEAAGPVTESAAHLEFSGGTVAYLGDPRGAIETLVQHGADRARMSVQLVLPDLGGIADVGDFGVAVAGESGWARGGAYSHVLVPGGYNGLAVAGRGGRATVGGYNGIAIVDANGHATACGLAVARGPGGWLAARDPGVAVALAWACALEVDLGGIAVALDRVQRITLGRHATAVVRDATGSRIAVRAGEGSLIVIRYFERPGGRPRFSLAEVGAGGLAPDVSYVWADGAFHPKAGYVAPDGGTSAGDEPDGAAPAEAVASPGPIFRRDTDDIVICTDEGGWAIAEGGGTASAGIRGLARSWEAAYARDGGVAITDGGKARAGARGVAICDDKRYGTADAGEGGVAVGLGSRFATITAGQAGAAIYPGSFGIVGAGDDGIAISGFESRVEVGANGVAITTCRCPQGGPGSLLVCRDLDGNVRSTIVADDGGIEPAFLAWTKQLERKPETPPSA